MSNILRPIRYQFGRFVVLPSERQVIKDGQPLSVGPRAFDVLQFLLEHHGGLVKKKSLLDHAWPGLVVEDNTLQAVISTLRKLLGSDAIATVSKFGYRFNIPVDAQIAEKELRGQVIGQGYPLFHSSFIGRKKELAALASLLKRARNVTIVGPGGAGKTRLALETALSLEPQFAQGFRFLDLTSMSERSMLTNRAAALFDLPERASSSSHDALIAYLRDRSMLLIIDNAEHMISAVAEMTDELLSRCENIWLLTTSRQATGSIGELPFRIPALSLPSADKNLSLEMLLASDSFRLFVERAELQKPHFELTHEAAGYIASICNRLDGMPLSIELAASRIRSMSVQEIDSRLDQALRLLVTQPSDAPKRHQTLRALIEWGYELLNPEEQEVFRRVSVFAGGFTLDMVEAVFASAGVASWTLLDVLKTLIDKSMLTFEQSGPVIRYRQLETVRQYAIEKLFETNEAADWKRLHLVYFTERVAEGNSTSAYLSEALREVAGEQDNVEAALLVALEREDLALLGLQMSVGLTRYWFSRGRQVSGGYWLSKLLSRTPKMVDDLLRIKAQSWIGVFLNASGDFEAANRAHAESVQLASAAVNGQGALLALNNFALSLADQGAHSRALPLMLDAIGLLGRATQNQVATELAELPQYSATLLVERLPSGEINVLAKDLAEQLLAPASKLALQLRNLGMHLLRASDYANAERALQEAIGLARQLSDAVLIGSCETILGNVAERLGKSDDSLRIFAAAFRTLVPFGENKLLCSVVDGIAGALIRCGNPTQAARFWGASERLRIETELVMTPEDLADQATQQALAVRLLGHKTLYQSLFDEGYDADIRALLDTVVPDILADDTLELVEPANGGKGRT